MTNEEKARILSNKGCLGAYISRDAESLNPTEEDKKRLSIYGACMEAMEWKDEQIAQEKQQWIDKACERLEYYFAPDGSMVPENIRLWRDLQQVIKGE